MRGIDISSHREQKHDNVTSRVLRGNVGAWRLTSTSGPRLMGRWRLSSAVFLDLLGRGGTGGTTQERFSSCLFCGRPSWAVLARSGMTFDDGLTLQLRASRTVRPLQTGSGHSSPTVGVDHFRRPWCQSRGEFNVEFATLWHFWMLSCVLKQHLKYFEGAMN